MCLPPRCCRGVSVAVRCSSRPCATLLPPLPAGLDDIILSDANFHDWPLGERAVIESLQAWARTGRRMTLLACSYDDVVRRHAPLCVGAASGTISSAAVIREAICWIFPAPSGRPAGCCNALILSVVWA